MKTIKDLEYSFNHTKDRILERYDIKITRAFYDNMCLDMKKLSSPCVKIISAEPQKDDIQIIADIHYKFMESIRVVWSSKRRCITTAIKRKYQHG